MRGALTVLTMAVLVGCGAGGVIEVTNVRIGQPTGPNAALYLRATGGEEDRLVGARTDVAEAVVLHETVVDADGTTSMRPVDAIALDAAGSLMLEPAGYHLMLTGVDRLQVGDRVQVTLVWEQAGEMVVEAEVVAPGATMGHDG
jgi:hypothetical protein